MVGYSAPGGAYRCHVYMAEPYVQPDFHSGDNGNGLFLIACFLDAAPQKHLFTFNLLFDVLLFADLCCAGDHLLKRKVALASWRLRSAVAAGPLLLACVFFQSELRAEGLRKQGAFAPNLAQTKRTAQSSTYADTKASAASATDGIIDGNFFHGAVTHTKAEVNPWWEVDLGTTSTINSIVIWNRTDCCSDRLNDYWIFVSDIPFAATDTPEVLRLRARTFASHHAGPPLPSMTLAVNSVGRYVRVQLSGLNVLSLAEVQVYGQ